MTTYALPRRRGLWARLVGGADDFTLWLMFGEESWLVATLKGVPLFLFVYFVITYIPNWAYYGVTQFIPFLNFSPDVGFIVANGVAGGAVVLVVVGAVVAQASRGRHGPGWLLIRLLLLATFGLIELTIIPLMVFLLAGGSFIPPRFSLVSLGLGTITAGMGAASLVYLSLDFRRVTQREARAARDASREAAQAPG